MISRTVNVGSSVGLHARPAHIIAETAGGLSTAVTLTASDRGPVDASSALLVMTLGARHGAEVVVTGESQHDVDQIADLVARDLDA